MTEWETFCDECYYHMWRVRRKSERHFDDGFHVNKRDEANALVELLNKLERERDKATENATNYFARLGEVERERDEAREQLRLANIDCYAALTELDAARELADRVAGERDESSAQLAAERALADRLAGILDLYYADDTVAHHAGIADAITAWKEARMIDAAIDANKSSRMIELC